MKHTGRPWIDWSVTEDRKTSKDYPKILSRICEQIEEALSGKAKIPEFRANPDLVISRFSRTYFYTEPCALEIRFVICPKRSDNDKEIEVTPIQSLINQDTADNKATSTSVFDPPISSDSDEVKKDPDREHLYILITVDSPKHLDVKVTRTNAENDIIDLVKHECELNPETGDLINDHNTFLMSRIGDHIYHSCSFASSHLPA